MYSNRPLSWTGGTSAQIGQTPGYPLPEHGVFIQGGTEVSLGLTPTFFSSEAIFF